MIHRVAGRGVCPIAPFVRGALPATIDQQRDPMNTIKTIFVLSCIPLLAVLEQNGAEYISFPVAGLYRPVP